MTLPTALIVDDHRVVAEGLVRLLSDRFEIAGTITDGRLVADAVGRLRPDILLLDMSLPHVSGLEVLRQLRRLGAAVKTIALTMHADANLAVEALKAGASGFVLKESSGEELLTALQEVLAGRTYLASGLTREIVTRMVAKPDHDRIELTIRQREVLRLIVQGLRAKEIAAALELSTRTVEAIKYRTMQILNIHSTAELVRYAIEHGLVR